MMEDVKERPITLRAHEVRVLLERGEGQIRRMVKPQPNVNESFSHQFPPHGPRTSYGYSCWYPNSMDKRARHYGSLDHFLKGFPVDFCPYGKPGDWLWCKEGWGVGARSGLLIDPCISYKAGGQLPLIGNAEPDTWSIAGSRHEVNDSDLLKVKDGWRSPILMPRWASRLTLEITEVRVEHLERISTEDAIASGFSGREEFSMQWKPDVWNANPWTWAISVKVVKQARPTEEDERGL